jgi:hypothetical protein
LENRLILSKIGASDIELPDHITQGFYNNEKENCSTNGGEWECIQDFVGKARRKVTTRKT